MQRNTVHVLRAEQDSSQREESLSVHDGVTE